MSKKVLVAVADGTEELEAVTIIDVLRRAKFEVTVASVMPGHEVACSRGVHLVADKLIGECLGEEWDAIICPGGMPGAENLSESEALVSLLNKQNDSRKLIGAICAAPQVVLAKHGLLRGMTATAYPGFREKLGEHGVNPSDDAVVSDVNIITSQGPGTAMMFSLVLIRELAGEVVCNEVAEGLLV